MSIAGALVAGGLGAWLAAREDLKGQTIGAAAVAGALGGTLARVLAPRAAGWTVVLGVCLAGVVGMALAAGAGLREMVGALYGDGVNGTLAALGRVSPLDWAAGALMGAPVGMTWAGSMVEKKQEGGVRR